MRKVKTEQAQLLRGEAIFESIEIVELREEAETPNPNRLLQIRGTAIRGGVVNSNMRMYPTSVLNRATEKAQSKIAKGKFVGELDHPMRGSGSLSAVAMKFLRLWMEGDYLKFEADVLPTDKGQQLATLIRSGVKPGMSTRGYGAIDEREINGQIVFVVKDDFELAGIDAVLEESNQYSRITSYKEEGGVPVELTLEQLKRDYPDLVQCILRESEDVQVRLALEKEFEQKIALELSAKKEAWMDEVRKSIMETDDVKRLKSVVDAVLEAVKPVLPSQVKVDVDAALQAENVVLKADVDAKCAKIAKLEQELSALVGHVQERDNKEAVLLKIEEKVKGHRFGTLLKERLLSCKTVDDVERHFVDEVKFVDKLLESSGQPKGNAFAPPEREVNASLDDARIRHRTLAGIKGGSKE